MNTCYLAGPMTGISLHNYPAFDITAERLRKAGWSVVSPADLDRASGLDAPVSGDLMPRSIREECIIRDIHAILDCDAVAVLPGWKKSKGVRVEISLALFLGIEILDAQTMEPIDPEELEEILPCLL